MSSDPVASRTMGQRWRWMRLLLRSLLGPFGAWGRWTICIAVGLTLVLTLFTQVGGLLLWPFWYSITKTAARFPRWKRRGLTVLWCCVVYLVGGLVIVPQIAQYSGRVRLPLYATQALPTGPLHIGYALLLRNYVQPHTYAAYTESVLRFQKDHPGVTVRYLDAGFVFPTLPLLPHLSHSDGQKIDVAFLFMEDGVYVDRARSPIGYWGYAKESPERSECTGVTQKLGPLSIPLRWDFDALQPFWPELHLDVAKNRALFRAFAADPRVCSILLEPGLHTPLRAPKLTKNSCAVARHDDHFHLTTSQSCR